MHDTIPDNPGSATPEVFGIDPALITTRRTGDNIKFDRRGCAQRILSKEDIAEKGTVRDFKKANKKLPKHSRLTTNPKKIRRQLRRMKKQDPELLEPEAEQLAGALQEGKVYTTIRTENQ